MTFPPGYFGTRADLLMDLVVTSLVVFIPLLIYSFRLVRAGHYKRHRNIQVGIAAVLLVVVSLLEWDIRSLGGILKIAQGGQYGGTDFLKYSFSFHLFWSGLTSVVWFLLILLSLARFSNPPAPNSFSRFHRFFGRVGMLGMAMTAITGIEVYIIGFAL